MFFRVSEMICPIFCLPLHYGQVPKIHFLVSLTLTWQGFAVISVLFIGAVGADPKGASGA